MPKPIKKRIEKKTTPEEGLKETVEDLKVRLKQRQRILVYSLIIFSALTVAVVSFVLYNKATANRASDLELEGYRLFHGDYATQSVSPEDRYKKALKMFQDSYEKKKKPHVLLYIAYCYYELGKYDESIKTLKELNNQFSDPQIISLSYYKMAMTYVKKGDMENALNSLKNLSSIKNSPLPDMFHSWWFITLLKNLSSIKNSPLQDVALMESGKILDHIGKKEEAKSKYKELINNFPKSALANEAKVRLGE
jgi:tetratricopeptide (TPR) repeat protein